ncbi:hypothetical protein BD779DRAFT_1495280 [Infundibulicybe gibba]|nr:hypothetical protein BD779DRAFT_1495280 [Infundibulicybe gibba]
MLRPLIRYTTPIVRTPRHRLWQHPSPQLWIPSRGRPTPRPPALPRFSAFHSTPRAGWGPLIPILATLLKASTAFEFARTAGRVVSTFIPLLLLKNHKTRRKLRDAGFQEKPGAEEKKVILLKKLRNRTLLFHLMLLVPVFLFWATIVASLERAPLTGRWRMILLSPDEEDEIAAQLAGQGWYNAVCDILSQDGPTKIIPKTDWRYAWVNDTLRKLEATIPVLVHEPEMCADWLQRDDNSIPLPPPSEYPLRPRPRASDMLHWYCEMLCNKKPPTTPHSVAGPPYSLLVVDRPEASNAFSYGFGPNGSGGVVVYSGFLDDIFSRHPLETPLDTTKEPVSWWSRLFGGIFSPPSPPRHPVPSAEQTAELAILLAHELAHLVLSHHLESLSSATVILPGTLSMASDIIRVLIFPITMLFGPFVNDAVAQLGKIGSGELMKLGETCTGVTQEIEADVVSARLLAHAGFDARDAVKFWETRSASSFECAKPDASTTSLPPTQSDSLVRRIMGAGHPVNEVRVDKLKEELTRWEAERQKMLARLRLNGSSS